MITKRDSIAFSFSAVIFVIDSSNRERMSEAHDELAKLMAEKRLKDALLLIYANKQVRIMALRAQFVDFSGFVLEHVPTVCSSLQYKHLLMVNVGTCTVDPAWLFFISGAWKTDQMGQQHKVEMIHSPTPTSNRCNSLYLMCFTTTLSSNVRGAMIGTVHPWPPLQNSIRGWSFILLQTFAGKKNEQGEPSDFFRAN